MKDENVEQISDLYNLIAQFKQVSPDFIKNYCIINGNVLPLEAIEKMDLNEYATRSLFDLPKKIYKYYPDWETTKEENGAKITKNYSEEALKSNEVYLSSPFDFDDPFDSEIHVSWEEFEEYQIRTYAQWSKCDITHSMSVNEIADALLQKLYDAVHGGGKLKDAFDITGKEGIEQLHIEVFVLQLENEFLKNKDPGATLKNVLWKEYEKFKKDLQQKFRVACFTTTPGSQLMWSSYANEHKGFCIEYTVTDDPKYQEILYNLRPVIYCKKRSSATEAIQSSYSHNIDNKSLQDIYMNGVLRKSLDWAYQNEWRLMLPPEHHGQKGFTKQFFPITKVYLGNRMPANRRKEIIAICKRKGIPYAGVTRSTDFFEMEECKNVCETCPLMDKH